MMGKLARFIRFYTGEDDEGQKPDPGDGAYVDEALVDEAVLSE